MIVLLYIDEEPKQQIRLLVSLAFIDRSDFASL